MPIADILPVQGVAKAPVLDVGEDDGSFYADFGGKIDVEGVHNTGALVQRRADLNDPPACLNIEHSDLATLPVDA